jgi:hypothetical protein
MCEQCKQQEMQLLPEFETMLNEYAGELFPELEFELTHEAPAGSRSSAAYIKWVQATLNQALGLKLDVDGKIGPMTRSAIRSFQRQNGLDADGIVGSKTEAALNAATAGAPQINPQPMPATVSVKPMVDLKKVSCLTSRYKDSIFRKIGTNDPVAVLEAACRRAVEMLTNTIKELVTIKARVAAGEPPAFPLISDFLSFSLRTRMLMQVDDPKAWTSTGTRNAGLIIRWLTNIRDLIASGDLWYTCLAEDTMCPPGRWAWVFTNNDDNRDAGLNLHRIHFCLPFWHPGGKDETEDTEFRAQIIIHETSHIYYNTEDTGMGPGRAECIAQFISDANNSPIRPGFVGQCGVANP